MRKNYNAPLVEAASLVARYNMLQAVSPAVDLGTSYTPAGDGGISIGGN